MQDRRRKVRELAMQVLFAWDANSADDAEVARQIVDDSQEPPPLREEALKAARGVWEGRTTSDPWIERLAPQWPIKRQPAVDRSLLRLAIWELTSHDTPPKVVIDEAIELAKQYSTEQSPAFINGVLDAVLREHQALTKLPDASE